MQISISLDEQQYLVNTDFAFSTAIPLNFNHQQPNHFAAYTAQKKAMAVDKFIGDTEQGGSCNVNELSLNPHCNGTHTETIRHICDQESPLSLPISAIEIPPLMPCALITITPENGIKSGEEYTPALQANDLLITRNLLASKLAPFSNAQLQSVAIRTLPNNAEKCVAVYSKDNQPAFFSREAIHYLNERGVQHLLVDIPSIDRLHDDGLLTCHHLFWQVIESQHQPTTNSLVNKTITEMAYFEEQIGDGFYFINLQIPAFVNDAAPSRPVLYAAKQIENN